MAGIITIRGTESNGATIGNETEAASEAIGFGISARTSATTGTIMTGMGGMAAVIGIAAVAVIATIASEVTIEGDSNANIAICLRSYSFLHLSEHGKVCAKRTCLNLKTGTFNNNARVYEVVFYSHRKEENKEI